MASEDPEFKIKGAASTNGSSSPPASVTVDTEDTADQPADTDNVDAKNKSESLVEEAEEVSKTARKRKADEIEPDEQDKELKGKYKWFKCEVFPPDNTKPFKHYYLHQDTMESRWEEPDEPFWIYDSEAQKADDKAGLQNAWKAKAKRPSVPENYGGYIPAIHGNYDPTAPYAKWHEQKRAEEAAQAQPASTNVPGAAPYESAMALNRFTGHVQRSDLNPERHTDSAKAGRQLNAFFDPEAAANAHDGRSLKEERKAKQLTKKEIQEFTKRNKERKEAKQRARFL